MTTYYVKNSTFVDGLRMRAGNTTSYSINDLSRYSKGIWVIDSVNLGLIGRAEKGSGKGQFESQRLIYANNPSYVPQWAIDEELSYPPKFREYGTTIGTIGTIDYADPSEDPTGENVVSDPDSTNADDLPKTIRDILATLP